MAASAAAGCSTTCSPQPTDVNRGNNVLGEIFGAKDVSRQVADNAAAGAPNFGSMLGGGNPLEDIPRTAGRR